MLKIYELHQLLNMSSTRLHVGSLNLFLNTLGLQLCLVETFPVFSPVRLLIRELYLASDEAFQKASCIAPRHDICRWFKLAQLA